MDDLQRRAARALEGNLATQSRQARVARTSCSCAIGSTCCSTRARSSRTGCSRTRWRRPTTCPPTASSPASARSTGRPVCVMANDPTVKAGSWGARTVEKIIRLTERALRRRAARLLARRLRGRAHHRPGRAVPGSPWRGPHLRQPGAPLGQGAAGVLPVRPVGRGRRVHPELLRHRRDGRGQRVDVPRLAAHGRDGDRRDRHARGDGRRAHARHGVGVRRQPRGRRRRSDRAGRSAGSRTCRRRGGRCRRACAAADPVRPLTADVVPAEERRAYDMHRVVEGLIDEGSFFEVKPLYAPELIVGFGRHRRSIDRRRREQPDAEGRRAVRRLRRQGGTVPVAVRRVQRAAAVPRRRARLHGRHRGRAPGHHPPRSQDDHRGHRSDGAEGVRDRAQGVWRRALRDVGAGVRPDRDARACRRRRSR